MRISSQKREKKEYFASLNGKNITNNRKFWQAVKLFLSEKNKSRERITLLGDEEVVSYDVEVANALSNFFLKHSLKFGDTRKNS